MAITMDEKDSITSMMSASQTKGFKARTSKVDDRAANEGDTQDRRSQAVNSVSNVETRKPGNLPEDLSDMSLWFDSDSDPEFDDTSIVPHSVKLEDYDDPILRRSMKNFHDWNKYEHQYEQDKALSHGDSPASAHEISQPRKRKRRGGGLDITSTSDQCSTSQRNSRDQRRKRFRVLKGILHSDTCAESLSQLSPPKKRVLFYEDAHTIDEDGNIRNAMLKGRYGDGVSGVASTNPVENLPSMALPLDVALSDALPNDRHVAPHLRIISRVDKWRLEHASFVFDDEQATSLSFLHTSDISDDEETEGSSLQQQLHDAKLNRARLRAAYPKHVRDQIIEPRDPPHRLGNPEDALPIAAPLAGTLGKPPQSPVNDDSDSDYDDPTWPLNPNGTPVKQRSVNMDHHPELKPRNRQPKPFNDAKCYLNWTYQQQICDVHDHSTQEERTLRSVMKKRQKASSKHAEHVEAKEMPSVVGKKRKHDADDDDAQPGSVTSSNHESQQAAHQGGILREENTERPSKKTKSVGEYSGAQSDTGHTNYDEEYSRFMDAFDNEFDSENATTSNLSRASDVSADVKTTLSSLSSDSNALANGNTASPSLIQTSDGLDNEKTTSPSLSHTSNARDNENITSSCLSQTSNPLDYEPIEILSLYKDLTGPKWMNNVKMRRRSPSGNKENPKFKSTARREYAIKNNASKKHGGVVYSKECRNWFLTDFLQCTEPRPGQVTSQNTSSLPESSGLTSEYSTKTQSPTPSRSDLMAKYLKASESRMLSKADSVSESKFEHDDDDEWNMDDLSLKLDNYDQSDMDRLDEFDKDDEVIRFRKLLGRLDNYNGSDVSMNERQHREAIKAIASKVDCDSLEEWVEYLENCPCAISADYMFPETSVEDRIDPALLYADSDGQNKVVEDLGPLVQNMVGTANSRVNGDGSQMEAGLSGLEKALLELDGESVPDISDSDSPQSVTSDKPKSSSHDCGHGLWDELSAPRVVKHGDKKDHVVSKSSSPISDGKNSDVPPTEFQSSVEERHDNFTDKGTSVERSSAGTQFHKAATPDRDDSAAPLTNTMASLASTKRKRSSPDEEDESTNDANIPGSASQHGREKKRIRGNAITSADEILSTIGKVEESTANAVAVDNPPEETARMVTTSKFGIQPSSSHSGPKDVHEEHGIDVGRTDNTETRVPRSCLGKRSWGDDDASSLLMQPRLKRQRTGVCVTSTECSEFAMDALPEEKTKMTYAELSRQAQERQSQELKLRKHPLAFMNPGPSYLQHWPSGMWSVQHCYGKMLLPRPRPVGWGPMSSSLASTFMQQSPSGIWAVEQKYDHTLREAPGGAYSQ